MIIHRVWISHPSWMPLKLKQLMRWSIILFYVQRRWRIYCSDWSRWFISVVWVVRVARVVPIVFPEAANTFSRRDFENWTNTHKVGHQCCETMEPMLETMEQTQNSDPKWLQSPFCCLAYNIQPISQTLNNTVSNKNKDHHNHSHTVNNQLNKVHHNHSVLLLLFCILWWNWEVFCT